MRCLQWLRVFGRVTGLGLLSVALAAPTGASAQVGTPDRPDIYLLNKVRAASGQGQIATCPDTQWSSFESDEFCHEGGSTGVGAEGETRKTNGDVGGNGIEAQCRSDGHWEVTWFDCD